MKNEKENKGAVAVTAEPVPTPAVTAAPVPEVPKAAVTPTPTVTADQRKYQFVKAPSVPPKGKQRIITLQALTQDVTRAYTVKEVADFATAAGLISVYPVFESVKWHLHQCELLGLVKRVN